MGATDPSEGGSTLGPSSCAPPRTPDAVATTTPRATTAATRTTATPARERWRRGLGAGTSGRGATTREGAVSPGAAAGEKGAVGSGPAGAPPAGAPSGAACTPDAVSVTSEARRTHVSSAGASAANGAGASEEPPAAGGSGAVTCAAGPGWDAGGAVGSGAGPGHTDMEGSSEDSGTSRRCGGMRVARGGGASGTGGTAPPASGSMGSSRRLGAGTCSTGVPQTGQNLASSGSCAPHLRQYMGPPLHRCLGWDSSMPQPAATWRELTVGSREARPFSPRRGPGRGPPDARGRAQGTSRAERDPGPPRVSACPGALVRPCGQSSCGRSRTAAAVAEAASARASRWCRSCRSRCP